MIIIGIVISLILFSVIILIHELGHFTAARKFGVKVEEFGLGIPPRAKKLFTDKKGTLYSLNWLPIGGFVKLKGETEISNQHSTFEEDKKNNLFQKPIWQQSIILLAGVFMNFLFAIIIFSSLFFVGIQPIGINTKIETNLDVKLIPTYEKAIKSGILLKKEGILLNPVKGSIAEKSGIQSGDLLIKINGIKINSPEEIIKKISNNIGKKIKLSFKNKEIKIIIPKNGKIGAYLSENIVINDNFKYKYGFLNSIKYGTLETYNQTLLTFKGLGLLIQKIFNPKTPKERDEAIQEVSGPIGIVDFISNSFQAGFIFLLILSAIISINLGVFNLLPIPALDGGRFFILIINGTLEKIFGKKIIGQNIEGLIHLGFFIILIALSLIIAYNDVSKILLR